MNCADIFKNNIESMRKNENSKKTQRDSMKKTH